MKNKILITLLTVFSILALFLYINKPEDVKEPNEKSEKFLTFSNLVDEAGQDETRAAMEGAGIPSENIDSFFAEVDYFNKTIEEKSLVQDSFSDNYELERDYDLVAMESLWNEKNLEFIGHNCRMISFDLMKDFILIEKPNSKDSDWLIFDKNAIENSPRDLFSETEYENYKTLFASIPAEKTKDISIHVKNIQKSWSDKGIEFKNSDKASLISVFFHDFEDYLFIGHMGILIPAKDGGLLFIEKLSFHAPYQVIRFEDRLELNDYLMAKYDISWNQPEANPFIFENDNLLEGYRENQNKIRS